MKNYPTKIKRVYLEDVIIHVDKINGKSLISKKTIKFLRINIIKYSQFLPNGIAVMKLWLNPIHDLNNNKQNLVKVPKVVYLVYRNLRIDKKSLGVLCGDIGNRTVTCDVELFFFPEPYWNPTNLMTA